jgi:hypothetical protein
MPQARQQRIDEILKNDPWYTADTRLDLSQFPHLIPRESTQEDKFAPLDTRGTGSNELKEFLTQQTAERDAGPSVVHVGEHKFRITYRDGVWTADGEVNGQRHRYTAPDREALLGKLMKVARPAIRELTQAQRLEVVRMCQAGEKYKAIDLYIHYALGHLHRSDEQLLADPALLPLLDQIAEETWFYSEPDAPDSEEWHAFKEQFAANRPLNHDILDSAFAAFKEAAPRVREMDEAEEPEEPEPDLNDLSDEEVQKVYTATVRQSARSARR